LLQCEQAVLDAASVALLTGAAVWYFATPEIVERPLRPLAYDRDGNIYASLQCIEFGTMPRFVHRKTRIPPPAKSTFAP